MENLTFENLPTEVHLLSEKLDNIEKLLLQQNKQQQPDPQDQFLTVVETAKFLNLTVPTIYSKVSRGELPVMKQGKRLYFSQADLIEYVKRGKKLSNYEIEAQAEKYLSNNKKGLNYEK